MLYLTRRETFNAAHKLHIAEWSDEKNLAVFGKCSNRNWHGHNYELFVTVGHPDSVTGFVMDAKQLSNIMKKEIVDQVDHQNFNIDVEWVPKGMQPTTENLLILFWDRIEQHINSIGEAKLYSIRLRETENIYAEYFGPTGRK